VSNYTHIFFDLDRTLWDYDSNATITLHDLIDRYKIINGYAIQKEEFIQQFFTVNDDLWARFDEGSIDKEYIRTKRFKMVLEGLGINEFNYIEQLQEDFISECPTKGKLIAGAREMIEELSRKYSLYIITNGFDGIQHTKIKFAGLEEYFDEIITSERAQVQKPNPLIFEYALKIANVDKSRSIMIGDNFDSDIIGAKAAGIDQVYFNPENRKNGFNPTFEITHLDQLSNILL